MIMLPASDSHPTMTSFSKWLDKKRIGLNKTYFLNKPSKYKCENSRKRASFIGRLNWDLYFSTPHIILSLTNEHEMILSFILSDALPIM